MNVSDDDAGGGDYDKDSSIYGDPAAQDFHDARRRRKRRSTLNEAEQSGLTDYIIGVIVVLLELLTSTIGLFALNLTYLLLGSYIFLTIEAPREKSLQNNLQEQRNELVDQLIILGRGPEDQYFENASQRLAVYERSLAQFYRKRATLKQGFGNASENLKLWTPSGSVIYCFSVMSTIGWGNIVPATTNGRLGTIVYGLFGVPLLFTLSTEIGNVLSAYIASFWIFVLRNYKDTMLKRFGTTPDENYSTDELESEEEEDEEGESAISTSEDKSEETKADTDEEEEGEDENQEGAEEEDRGEEGEDEWGKSKKKKNKSRNKSPNRYITTDTEPLLPPKKVETHGGRSFVSYLPHISVSKSQQKPDPPRPHSFMTTNQNSAYVHSIQSTLDFLVHASRTDARIEGDCYIPHYRIRTKQDAMKLMKLFATLAPEDMLRCMKCVGLTATDGMGPHDTRDRNLTSDVRFQDQATQCVTLESQSQLNTPKPKPDTHRPRHDKAEHGLHIATIHRDSPKLGLGAQVPRGDALTPLRRDIQVHPRSDSLELGCHIPTPWDDLEICPIPRGLVDGNGVSSSNEFNDRTYRIHKPDEVTSDESIQRAAQWELPTVHPPLSIAHVKERMKIENMVQNSYSGDEISVDHYSGNKSIIDTSVSSRESLYTTDQNTCLKPASLMESRSKQQLFCAEFAKTHKHNELPAMADGGRVDPVVLLRSHQNTGMPRTKLTRTNLIPGIHSDSASTSSKGKTISPDSLTMSFQAGDAGVQSKCITTRLAESVRMNSCYRVDTDMIDGGIDKEDNSFRQSSRQTIDPYSASGKTFYSCDSSLGAENKEANTELTSQSWPDSINQGGRDKENQGGRDQGDNDSCSMRTTRFDEKRISHCKTKQKMPRCERSTELKVCTSNTTCTDDEHQSARTTFVATETSTLVGVDEAVKSSDKSLTKDSKSSANRVTSKICIGTGSKEQNATNKTMPQDCYPCSPVDSWSSVSKTQKSKAKSPNQKTLRLARILDEVLHWEQMSLPNHRSELGTIDDHSELKLPSRIKNSTVVHKHEPAELPKTSDTMLLPAETKQFVRKRHTYAKHQRKNCCDSNRKIDHFVSVTDGLAQEAWQGMPHPEEASAKTPRIIVCKPPRDDQWTLSRDPQSKSLCNIRPLTGNESFRRELKVGLNLRTPAVPIMNHRQLGDKFKESFDRESESLVASNLHFDYHWSSNSEVQQMIKTVNVMSSDLDDSSGKTHFEYDSVTNAYSDGNNTDHKRDARDACLDATGRDFLIRRVTPMPTQVLSIDHLVRGHFSVASDVAECNLGYHANSDAPPVVQTNVTPVVQTTDATGYTGPVSQPPPEPEKPVPEGLDVIKMLFAKRERKKSNFFSPSDSTISITEESEDTDLAKGRHFPLATLYICVLIYVLFGSVIYSLSEDSGLGLWDSFYFMYVLLSTTGFGDLLPPNVFSIWVALFIYSVIGMALFNIMINASLEIFLSALDYLNALAVGLQDAG